MDKVIFGDMMIFFDGCVYNLYSIHRNRFNGRIDRLWFVSVFNTAKEACESLFM